VATGGGGYALVEAVPRAWTHLLATATGESIDPRTLIPREWQELARDRVATTPYGRLRMMSDGLDVPTRMTDDGSTEHRQWQPGDGDAVDRAVTATRNAVFPLLGLDPLDPRD
jgi:acetoin utilization protein AcuC